VEPVRAAPSLPPYLIIPETNAEHDTTATAQHLPDEPFFGVVGAMSPGDTTDYFVLNPDRLAASIEVGLTLGQQQAEWHPVVLVVLDGSGRTLATWRSDAPGPGSVTVPLDPRQAVSTLYIGIGTEGRAQDGGAPLGYQLWVSMHSSPDRMLPLPNDIPALGGVTILPTIATSLMAVAGRAAATATDEAAPAAEDTAIGGRVVIGSPAPRAAAALGGIMAGADAATPLTSAGDASVIGAQAAHSASGQRGTHEPAHSAPSSPEAPGSVAVLRGPGGFPLLGGVAIGGRSPDLQGLNPVVTPTDAPPDPDSDDPTLPGLLAQRDAERASVVERPPGQASPAWFLTGLGPAALVTLNVAFSNPLAGFDYLYSCLEPRLLRRRGSRSIEGAGDPDQRDDD
jgi:hypothetical protein